MSDKISTHRLAPPRLHLSLAPEPSRLLRARERIRDYLTLHCTDKTAVNDLVLAIEEAATNAIRHSGSDADIEIRLAFRGANLHAAVRDKGRAFDVESFDPHRRPDPLLDHGRGLYIMARLSDEMKLGLDGGLEVRLIKRAVLATRSSGDELDGSLVPPGRRTSGDSGRARAMLDEIDEGFVALDWEYRFTYVNAAASRLLGRPSDELLGRGPLDLWSELVGSELERAARQAMELGRPSIVDYKTDAGAWLEARFYPTTVGLSVYFRDIDERKRRELERDELLAALRDSEERYRQLFQSESDAILLIDQQSGAVLEVNAAAQVMYGYATDELLGLTDLDLSAEPDLTRQTTRAATAGDDVAVSLRMHRRKDGSTFPVEMTGRVFSLRGRLVRIAAVRDISARKQVEEALGRFQLLAANSRDIILFMDRDGRIIDANEAAERAYGYSRDELLRLTIADLRAAPTQGEIASQMAEADGQGILFESLHRRRDGSVFAVEVSSRGATVGDRRTLVSVVRDITERKATEEALRAGEERARFLAGVVEKADVPFAVREPGGRLVLFNQAFVELVGYSRRELEEGASTLAVGLTPPNWWEVEEPLLAEAVAARRPVRYEKEYLRKDGSRVPVEVFAQPVFDGAGEFAQYHSFITDISERKRAEGALHQSEEHYRTMVETAAEGVVVAGLDGTYTYVNQRMADMLGYAPEEIIGKSIHDLTSDDGLRAQILGARHELRQGDAVHGEIEFRRKDGSSLWTAYSISPLRDASGEHIGNLAMHTDITERKQAEGALQESRAELAEAVTQRQLALDAAKLGWWRYDPLANVSWYDEGYRTIFDVTGSERPNDEILERLHPDDLPDVWAKVEAALDPVDPKPYAAEYRIYRSDGSLRWVEAHGIASFEGEGDQRHAASLVGTVQDITERKQAEEQLQRLLEQSLAQSTALQTAQEQLTQELDTTVLLSEAVGFLSQSLALSEVLDRLAQIIMKAGGHARVTVSLWREPQGRLEVVAAQGEPIVPIGLLLTLDELSEPARRSIGERKSTLIDYDALEPGRRGVGDRLTSHLSLNVPLFFGERFVGLVSTDDPGGRREFSAREIRLIEGIGAQAAVAIENARLFSDSLETSRHLTNVLQGMTDGFISVDHKWRYTLVNAQAEQLIGRPAAELLGRSMEELFPDMEGWSHYRTVMSERRPETFEVWSRPLQAWLEVHAYPTADGLSILFTDITALRAAAEELRLHNADLAERAHFADSLNAINRLLHATLDFGTIMQGALGEGVEALDAAAALIEMREESQWVVRGQHGFAEADVGLRLSAAEAPIATRIEERGEPLAIADFDDAVAETGFVGAHGLRSVLAVPLPARGAVTGCLLFYDKKVRVFSDAEIDFGRKLGATVSLALENAQLYDEQQRIAQTLQENFIHELPAVAGLELGVVSQTATEPELVGGDFSDVFVLDDTHVVVLIGDVAGKGVRAAGLTETVRSTVRAFAAVDPSPAFVLTKTDELLLRHDPDGPHVTAFYCLLDPRTGHTSYASAGHPAPIHLGPLLGRPLAVRFGPPLGSFQHSYESAHTTLTLDDCLVLCTDGVTEARRGGDLFGERRLIEAVTKLRGLPAQELAEALVAAVDSYADRLADDIQVVTVRLV